MKRILLIFTVLLFASTAFAQTQQGIVKTRGRVVDGKVVAGTRLSGATITLNIGNPQRSGSQGTFSFNVPAGKSFSLVTATKQGYTLADPEYTRRSFKYSASNPFYVVLEDEAQRQADINAATRKVRRTLIAQLQAREDEIEVLKAQNKLTEAEYQKRLQELYDNQSKSEQLVKEMAERSASIDYDQLDEYNRQVQMYIEEGELLKADSLISTRGSLEDRYARVKEQQTANTQREEEIRQQQASLAKSQELTHREKEDLMSDLYAKHTIYLQAYQQDSALYCLKMRADLDTTNLDAVWDYATLSKDQYKFEESEWYYLICLRAYLSRNDVLNVASLQENLGDLYFDFQRYEDSQRYLNSALENFELLQRNSLGDFYVDVSFIYNVLGCLYMNEQRYKESEEMLQEALSTLKRNSNDKSNENFEKQQVEILNNLGQLYCLLQNYIEGEKYFLDALNAQERLMKNAPESCRYGLAMIQNNLGSYYWLMENYTDAERYFLLSLDNFSKLYEQNPDAIRIDLVRTLNNIGLLLYNLKDYENSIKYFLPAVEQLKILSKYNPETFLENLCLTYNMLAYSYLSTCQYKESIQAIENAIIIVADNPNFYDTKGEILLMQGRNDEALEMWKKVLELNPNFLDDYPDGTNLSNGLKKLGLIE